MRKLVRFKKLAGIDCYYARRNSAYSDTSLCTKSRVRRLHPNFLQQMNACLLELKWLTMGVGDLYKLTSGGAFVDKPGEHRKGKAYDLGGLFWDRGGRKGTLVLTCIDMNRAYNIARNLPVTYPLYLASEAVLRRHFGTVLGIHYDEDHWNHWHVDSKTPVGFWTSGFGSTSRVRFLQEILHYIWHINVGAPDGKCGPKTRAGIKKIRERFDLPPLIGLKRVEAWRHLLLLTAMEAVQICT